MSEVRTPPRKLVDLNPTFWRYHGIDREGMGVIFDCPCGSESCEWGGKISVPFANPLDGGQPQNTEKCHWQRTGDTFETMTLSPSIHCVGHWHGWLRNGVLESC